jgi:signal transduction histidine kinase
MLNLNDIVANSLEDMMTNKQSSNKIKKINKITISSSPRHFYGADKGRISQVIHNLLDNAIKFTNVGTISINAQIKNGDKNDDVVEQLILSVKDTGNGINPEVCYKI